MPVVSYMYKPNKFSILIEMHRVVTYSSYLFETFLVILFLVTF